MNSQHDSLSVSAAVDSTPRLRRSSVIEEDLQMPDLLSDGSVVVAPRKGQKEWNSEEESDAVAVASPTKSEAGIREGSASVHLHRLTETASLVDSFNDIYQRQVNYYSQNYEPIEAMRVSCSV